MLMDSNNQCQLNIKTFTSLTIYHFSLTNREKCGLVAVGSNLYLTTANTLAVYIYIYFFSSVPPGKCKDMTSNYAMNTVLHTVSNNYSPTTVL
jgi:hypothetical protein